MEPEKNAQLQGVQGLPNPGNPEIVNVVDSVSPEGDRNINGLSL